MASSGRISTLAHDQHSSSLIQPEHKMASRNVRGEEARDLFQSLYISTSISHLPSMLTSAAALLNNPGHQRIALSCKPREVWQTHLYNVCTRHISLLNYSIKSNNESTLTQLNTQVNKRFPLKCRSFWSHLSVNKERLHGYRHPGREKL